MDSKGWKALHRARRERQLGPSGLTVSALGLGCPRMSDGDQPIGDRQEMVNIELTPADLAEMREAVSGITVVGDRH